MEGRSVLPVILSNMYLLHILNPALLHILNPALLADA